MSFDSPAAILFSRDGYDVATLDAYNIIPQQTGIISAARDGSVARFITADGYGNQIVVGSGTAGFPAGGILSIQGVSGGQAIPVTGTFSNPSVSLIGIAPPGSATYLGGSVTTLPPSYTDGYLNALSLTTTGLLRVDGSNVTQPVSGTVTVVQPNAANLHALVVGAAPDGYNPMGNPVLVAGWDGTNLHTIRTATDGTVRIDPTGTTTQPVSQVGAWNVSQVTSPWITIDAIADGYLQNILANQINGTQHTIVDGYVQTNPNVNATQVGTWTVQQGTPPWITKDGYVTTSPPTYINNTNNYLSLTTTGLLRVDGSNVTQPVSQVGTWTVQQGTPPWTVIGTSSDNSINVTTKLSALIARSNITAPTWTDGYQVPLSVTTDSLLRIDGVYPTGAAPGADATLIAGSVTTSLPSYTNGQMNNLSLTTNGLLRVTGGYADNTTNTIDKLPVLPAIANTSPRSWTDGYKVPLSTLLTGALRTDITSWMGSTAPTIGQKTAANSIPVIMASDQLVQLTGIIDNNIFTDGTTRVQPSGYIFDEVAGTALTEDDAAAARIDSKRAQIITIEDGTTRGLRNTIKGASTAAVAADPSLVVTMSPNTAAIPINQFGIISTGNSTNINLAAGATFTGTSISGLGYELIQFHFKSDRPHTIFIEHSQDGANWDVVDTFYARANFGTSQSIKLVDEFFRARITNTGASTSTFLRFECNLMPIGEPTPRTLTSQGNFKVALQDNEHEKQAGFTAFGLLKVAQEGMIGNLRFNSTTINTQWNQTITGIGNYTFGAGDSGITLNTGASTSSKISLTSKQKFYYESARSNQVKMSIILGDSGVANNIREWGLSDGYNGVFLRLSGTTLSIVLLNNGVETVAPTTSWDRPVTIDGYGHLWYIQFQWLGVGNFYIYYDEELVHTIRYVGTSTNLSMGTPDLPVYFKNENTSNTSNVFMRMGCVGVIAEGANIISGIADDGSIQEVRVDSNGNLQVVTATVSATTFIGLITGFLTLGGGTSNTLNPVRATTYNEQSTSAGRSISSANVNDTSAGTGAQQVTIVYYKSDGYGPFTEVVTMNGTSAVNTTNTDICFIEKMFVSRTGSGGFNAGVITLFVGTAGGGGTLGTMGVGNLVAATGDNTTLWAHHYVPPGKTASLATVILSNFGGTGSGITTMILKAKKIGVTGAADVLISDLIAVPTGNALVRQLGIPIRVVGPARVLGYTIPASNNTSSELSFDFSEI